MADFSIENSNENVQYNRQERSLGNQLVDENVLVTEVSPLLRTVTGRMPRMTSGKAH